MSEKLAVENKRGLSPAALLVAGAFFMEFIDGTVIATALPDMAISFGVQAVDLNIGISTYLITLAVLRTTPKHQLITAIATLTWPALVAPIIGPPLGGFITSYANWRWIFFINVPLGILAIVLALRFIPDIHDDERRPFDIAGFIATSVAMVSLVYAMVLLGAQQPQGWLTAGLLALGVMTFLFALHHFRRTAWPMIRLDAMSVPTFRITMYGGSLFRASISAVPFLLPLMFQVGFGMNAFHAGSLVLAVFVGNLTIKPATTPLIRRLGFKKLLLINGALNVLALLACALITPQTPTWVILLVLYLGGVFRSIQFTGVSTLAFADVPASQMSYANTLFSTATQLAVGLGISLAAIGIRIGDEISEWLALGNIPGSSFRLAFVMIAIICLVGMVDTLRLAPDAGSAVSNKNR
ncbi:MFS transporter [Citrobacter meridianamericanus]